MVTYQSRDSWGARAARGSTGLIPSEVEGEALHWPGMANPINSVGDAGYARIASALRGWQNYHMDDRGWSDIAYQIAIDQVGRAWTLRGLNIRSGANGDADVNHRFGAFLLILAPGEAPSAAMKATVKGVILDFRRWFSHASSTPKGHKDVRPAGTDCPGPLAYAGIQRGEFTPSTTTQGDWDMATADQVLAAVNALQADFNRFETIYAGRWAQEVEEARAQAAALSAQLTREVDELQADDAADDVLTTGRYSQIIEEGRAQATALTEKLDALAAAHTPPPTEPEPPKA
jgi:hypothetical protein